MSEDLGDLARTCSQCALLSRSTRRVGGSEVVRYTCILTGERRSPVHRICGLDYFADMYAPLERGSVDER